MASEITTIALRGVNCYLIQTGDGFLLVDTGFPFQRAELTQALEGAGCFPGNLHLIVITHRDWDHTGNGAYLQATYHANIAMHPADASSEQLTHRKMKPVSILIVALPSILRLIPKMRNYPLERFEPDIFLADGQSLMEYGWDATVLHVPGHTKGSIALLTEHGDLFCGDIIQDSYLKQGHPVFAQIIEDERELSASIKRLKQLRIKTVYPGHGHPFAWTKLVNGPEAGERGEADAAPIIAFRQRGPGHGLYHRRAVRTDRDRAWVL